MPPIRFYIGGPLEHLDPLPFAQKEALEVATILGTKALIKEEATKTAVIQRMQDCRIIHLATHGLLDDFKGLDVPGAIALAPSVSDDGLLTARELLDIDIDAELVVLSACNTGQGAITGDGVIGISRSFIGAGVPSIVVSLWAILDESTQFLMVNFYENLDKCNDKAQALRIAMLNTKADPHFEDPLHWAGFTLIGQAR
jgi:CHAT domain-containing protein